MNTTTWEYIIITTITLLAVALGSIITIQILKEMKKLGGNKP